MDKLIIIFALAFAVIMMAQTDGLQINGLDLDVLKANFLPAELAGLNFTAEDGRKILREKCRKVAGDNETVFFQAHRGILGFMKCISNVGNLTTIQDEIKEALPIGELDSVFHKYCSKQSQVEMCFNNLMIKINPCLTTEERTRHNTIMEIGSKLFGFVCYKGGDQIALFYAEQGPECLEENKENINNCINASFAHYVPKNGVADVNNLPQLIIGKQECQDLLEFEKCLLFHLAECEDITPSNIIESVLKFLKNEIKCQPKIKKKSKYSKLNAQSSASESISSTLTVGFALIALKLIIS